MTQEHYILVIIAMAACLCFAVLCIIANYLGKIWANQEEFMAMITFHRNIFDKTSGDIYIDDYPVFRTKVEGEPKEGTAV